MRYADFEHVITQPRMSRYLAAMGDNTKSAMTLYRKNLWLSQELFTIISCFEVTLRNGINRHYQTSHGIHWLRDSAVPGGFFDKVSTQRTKNLILGAYNKLVAQGQYTNDKLVAVMDFGFWRYLFAQPQFLAGGQSLLQVFPAKPVSTAAIQYNHTFVFNELEKINGLRNRIAHHEPVCFLPAQPVKNTINARQQYNLILQLFRWMNVDEAGLLYGLDHITTACNEIDAL